MENIRIEIKTQRDVITARQAARDIARDNGFRLADQTRLATAISELTRNIIQYAGEGICLIRTLLEQNNLKIIAEIEDHGPGIPDIEKAMTYGFSTGKGLGAGLPGAKSLVHEFYIESSPENTKVTVIMKKKK